MSVEFVNLLKYETKATLTQSGEAHWAKRKADLRAKRGLVAGHGVRRIRQTEYESLASRGTEQPAPTETTRDQPPPPARISAGETEWSGATGGPPAEVVLRLHPSSNSTPRANLSSLANAGGSGLVVRAEEALIVGFVLLLWIAAIALFFNRWGKIRMLEPYQPKFQQAHRQSCGVLADSAVVLPPHCVTQNRKFSVAQHRASLSRGCVSYDCGAGFPAYQPCGFLAHRPRQNSVFVGSVCGMALIPESPPRRSRSAADLPALVPPSDHSAHHTPRSSRAASLHSAVDLRPTPRSPRTSRAASLAGDMAVQVHVRDSRGSLGPRSPRHIIITNV